MKKFLIISVLLLPSLFAVGQDSIPSLDRRTLSNVPVLKISDRPIPYSDSLQSTLFTYFGQGMDGPQYFLILKEDSTFTWDAWYGNDSYIASGRYNLENDTLYLLGNINQTNTFEAVYKKAKSEWSWYNKIDLNKKLLILEKDSVSGQIHILKLMHEKKPKKVDLNRSYRKVTNIFFKKEDLEALKNLLTQMEEKKVDDEEIEYTESKILILKDKLNRTKPTAH